MDRAEDATTTTTTTTTTMDASHPIAVTRTNDQGDANAMEETMADGATAVDASTDAAVRGPERTRDARRFPDMPFCPARPKANRGTVRDERWTRPALRECSQEDFMLDFMRFHHARGRDWERCWSNLDRALARTGAPMDCMHLYRMICALGGFVNRESAKTRLSMTEIFKLMFNYYENHTMTDVGNRLLNAYENYFWEYELAHEDDVSRGTCRSCGGGIFHSSDSGLLHVCKICRANYHRGCQPPERFPETFGTGKDAGCSMHFVCWACTRSRPAEAGVESFKVRDAQTVDAADYYERLYEFVARRGRKYKGSYVLPTRAPADAPTEAPKDEIKQVSENGGEEGATIKVEEAVPVPVAMDM